MRPSPTARGPARRLLVTLFLAGALAGCGGGPPPDPPPSGTVELNPSGLRESGGGGSGRLFLDGRAYFFTIGGLGVQGAAVAALQTTGEVANLHDVYQLPGRYRAAPPAADPEPGMLRLQNENGVQLRLRAPPGGRLPVLGGDAVDVTLGRELPASG